ncbi:hypothetical protein ABIB35_002878 [Arthrobacter sp. UYP6]
MIKKSVEVWMLVPAVGIAVLVSGGVALWNKDSSV